jgi:ABC-type multidrug transport system ATPase subunit
LVKDSLIKLNNIVAFRGKYPVLSGVSAQIVQQERVWISGPNGAGKTSLLKVIAGLFAVTSGSGEVLNEDLRNYFLIREKVGYIGHRPLIYNDLTPMENLQYFARSVKELKHLSKKNLNLKIKEVLSELNFQDRLHDTKSSGLSEGQRKKLSIATVMIKQPQLILMDEPHGGLDKSSREFLDGFILKFTHNTFNTIIFTSHEDQCAAPIATRNISLKGGFVVSDVYSNVS